MNTLKKAIKQVPGILFSFFKNGGWASYLYVVLVLVKSFVPLVQTIGIAELVRNINNSTSAFWLAIIVICLLYPNLHYKIIEFIESKIKYSIAKRIDIKMMDLSCDIEFINFENSETYDKLKRVSNGGSIIFGAGRNLLIIIERTIEVFSLEIYLISFSPILALLFSFLLIILVAICCKTANLSWKSYLGTSELEREIEYTFKVITDHKNISELKLFRAYVPLKEKYNNKIDELSKIQLKTMLKNMVLQNISTLLLSVIVIIVLFFYSYLLIRGDVSSALFAGLFASIINIMNVISVYNINLSNFTQSLMSFDNLMEFFRYNKKSSIQDKYSDNNKRIPVKYIVQVCNIWFSYSKDERMVLQNLSLNISEGECVVLVGENGCGKSTLVKLILGLYAPSKGFIQIMNKPAVELLAEERPELVAIFQDYTKYNLSIRNILCDDKKIDDEELYDVLRKVGLYDFISTLNDGLDTILGNTFQGSTDFSEGQWQKLNIARVILSDSKILIFDEPTASLDPVAEANFYQEIMNLKTHKTMVIVSHRLGVVGIADKVCYMNCGKIVDIGSHYELMERCTDYSSMYQKQAKWYK